MFGFCQISAFPGPEWSKYPFRAKFLNKIENFLILPKFARRSGVVKNLIWAKFRQRLQISGVCQNFISFPCPEWSKSSILGQIFNTTQNLWILLNFILYRSGLVKNLFFEPGFQHFFISPNFILLGSRVVKILNFEPNFQRHSKFLDFAKFHCLWVQSGQKC